MILIAYSFFFVPYLLLSIFIVRRTMQWARNHERRPRLWGFIAGFFMYNLIFWDFLPTLIVHKYYCATECRFEVYKTAEQWRKENPDAVVGPIKMPEGMTLDREGYGTLYKADGTKLRYFAGNKKNEPFLFFESKDGTRGHWLNNRFFKITDEKKSLRYISTSASSEKIVDSVTGDIMTKYTIVGSGYIEGNWQAIKIWLDIPTCNPSGADDYILVNRNFRNIENEQ